MALLFGKLVDKLNDDIYDSAPNVKTNYLNGAGWSLFETHYAIGSCADIDSTSMSGLRYYINNTWQYATAATSVVEANHDGGNYSCFLNFTGSGNFYGLQYDSSDYGWSSTTFVND